MARLRVGVLISGRGSNLQALMDAAAEPDYPAEIVLVISNVPGAPGLARTAAAGIRHVTIDHRDFDSREAFETEITKAHAISNWCFFPSSDTCLPPSIKKILVLTLKPLEKEINGIN